MKVTDYLGREDIARFSAKSDLQAWRLVLGNWLGIIASFALVGWYPHPLLRDLSGRTGVKLLTAILRGAAGITSGEKRASGYEDKKGSKHEQ